MSEWGAPGILRCPSSRLWPQHLYSMTLTPDKKWPPQLFLHQWNGTSVGRASFLAAATPHSCQASAGSRSGQLGMLLQTQFWPLGVRKEVGFLEEEGVGGGLFSLAADPAYAGGRVSCQADQKVKPPCGPPFEMGMGPRYQTESVSKPGRKRTPYWWWGGWQQHGWLRWQDWASTSRGGNCTDSQHWLRDPTQAQDWRFTSRHC